jgi:predicted Zn-dependent protease
MNPVSRAVSAVILLLALLFTASGADSLKNPRIGKIIDAQGICALKPKLQDRWTPILEGMPLDTGDWLRTDVRGANALQGRLTSGGRFTLGPGGLVEMISEKEIRLIRGEMEIAPVEKSELILNLAGGRTQRITATAIFRVMDEQVTELKQEPNWLKSFKGAVTTESMGALLAKADGRDLPLTLGYHKVTVDIRDQIARTVIEESFVNHTSSQLEGVFHFPLPQDASISGFGMWIGDELVEADVVEKQRAREIFETILRERRDPGLLEWTGGNIFKARVFPIFAHSEKRIKISYTQVLPMQGNRYRYSYALQSEMFKQHPLRELALNVRIHSELPIRNVLCPTHEARLSRTTHSAQVEFSAQEYTPKRDFEVEIEADTAGHEVVMIPHKRGEDGYFLLLVSAPDTGKSRQRALIPEGPPLDLIIVADTSASIDRSQREAQAQFISSLLGSLGAKDRIRLLAADIDCKWFRDGESFAPTENEIATAREFLATRPSLGWTDLAHIFSNVFAKAAAGTQIVYVGDGIETTGDANPAAIAQALKQLPIIGGTVHAVAPGNSFEPGILKALAGIGGGSFRRIEGRNGPQTAAMALLGEIAQPAIRDLAIEFKGLRTARIYPEVLPNVPAGTQQIVLGRYLPGSRNLSGEVIVTGKLNGKPVRFASAVKLDTAESGNEFIPRLWARMHLDALLEQGQTQEIRDEIIALSEEYHLMTPYTSFLVLESDADRERFKVKRRFMMRDGERFFAEGRDRATLDLRQKQMQLAGQWRQDLRRNVLRELLELGRKWPLGRGIVHSNSMNVTTPFGGLGGTIGKGEGSGQAGGGGPIGEYMSGRLGPSKNGENETDLDGWIQVMTEVSADQKSRIAADPDVPKEMPMIMGTSASGASTIRDGLEINEVRWNAGIQTPSHINPDVVEEFKVVLSPADAEYGRGGPPILLPRSTPDGILTVLPSVPVDTSPPSGKMQWPEDAQRLSDSLMRQPKLDAMEGGLDIELRYNGLNPGTGKVIYESHSTMHYSPQAWISRTATDRDRALIDWSDSALRAVVCEAMQLGRQRKAQKKDLKLQLTRFGHYYDYSITPLAQTFPNLTPELKRDDKGNILLTLHYPDNPSNEQRFTIDPRRNVLLRRQMWVNGKISSQTGFDGFIEVGGCWWATKITNIDAEGRTTGITTASIKPVSAGSFEQKFKKALPDRNRALIIQEPLPELAAARQASLEKHASFEDLLTLIADFSQTQQWEQVQKFWQEAEGLAKNKPGIEWLKDSILEISRRNEELSQRYLARARQIVSDKPQDALFLSTFLQSRVNRFMQTNERLMFHESLRPIFERQPARLHADEDWRKMQAQLLQQAGRREEALRAWELLSKEFPKNTDIQIQHINAMVQAGELQAALKWIQSLLNKPNHWTVPEKNSVRNAVANQLVNRLPAAEWLAFLEEWLIDRPAYQQVYEYYLQALIRTHQVDKVNALITQWCEEGMKENGLNEQDRKQKTEESQIRSARFQAAVRIALGDWNYSWGNRRYDERWNPLLARVARETCRSKNLRGFANQIMQHYQFRQSIEAGDLRREFADVLLKDMDKLDSQTILSMASWIMGSDPAPKDETWQAIAHAMQAILDKEQDVSMQYSLGQSIIEMLRRLPDKSELLDFLRKQAKEGPASYRDTHVRQLFDELLTQRWNADFENECFMLLSRISSEIDAEKKLTAVIPALYRLIDSLLEGRYKALFDAVPGKESLSRTEYAALQQEKREEAREGLIKRLREEAGKQDAALAPWLAIERITLAAKQKLDARALAGECWELMGSEPARNDERTMLQWHFADRCLTTLIFLSARQARDEKPADQVLQFLDKGIKKNPDSAYWKYQKYRILVVLDRPAELKKTLESWIQPDKAEKIWLVALGYLMAEQDRVQDAIRYFETAKEANQLGAAELRTLADWHLAQGQKDKYEDVLISALMAEDEYRLSDRLTRIYQPWANQRESMPRELDPEAFKLFKALFRKSQYPQNHTGRLNDFYRNTHDFRLLECLAEGILGHTEQQIYPFIKGLQGIMNEVRDEATVDSIVKYLGKVRERAITRIDQRALDFLELQAERRAAELINQPGPHANAALAAMKRAFDRDWAPGERKLMADLLAGLGRIKGEELGREQLRQLEELYKWEDQPAEDRLQIAQRLAETQWAYDQKDEALVALEAALAQYRQVNKSLLPATANSALALFIRYLSDVRHFAQAELYLQNELKHPANLQQAYWMQERVFEVYTNALRYGGTVSLGSGEALYNSELKLFLAQIQNDDPNHRRQLIELMCSFFRAAKESKIEPVGLREFAFETFPAFLNGETDPNTYQQAISNLAATLHDLSGAKAGLEFLIERLEKEPDWAPIHSVWQSNSNSLAQWRAASRDLGNLEDRLLKIALDELRYNLRNRIQTYGAFYHRNWQNFWSEKAKDFLATANQVWDEQRPSGAAAKHIGEYLFRGLVEPARAIEILDEAWQAEKLDEQGLSQLAQYQHEINRYEESIPVLGELVRMRPDAMDYRARLMRAYFKTNKAGKLMNLLSETDKRFREKGLWQESTISVLASICLETQLYKESVAYYNELIPLHQRTQPNRGIGNGTLSNYYRQLSQAHAALNQTVEAVESAGGAVVSWGANINNRRSALDVLRSVLAQAADLNSYVEHLEKQVQETGLENPTVRQALGRVYLDRNDYTKAAKHLRLAVETQQNDSQTYDLLIRTYDRANDREGALKQLLESAELSRRDITLYKSLGDRYKSLGRQADAERAYTSIVEMQPNESESHTMLAELRQSQNRWPEAIDQWQHVARIRALEPTGLLQLAEAQIHEKRWEDARQTIDMLLGKNWPERFGNIRQQAQSLNARIER